ncbi:MAG: NUDIX domain-containing protein [Candidatus Paraimprobicoccus trichonymphae]|uniref:Bis(5'-nucleosyl)-tetraphosphatase [asymmetrical] n=1 Tax=Candidatus Paraimprobicoccus trichonymphae TaxID=3033793 RepID=A0AA48L084_9FIRM|nr:MAG: NUDIX domain-containing protein [Candidatus Paraimprobicoccus trichonymphae]
MILLHIIKEDEWKNSLKNKIHKDKLICCCTFFQLVEFLNNNFKKIDKPLVLLCVGTNKLQPNIKWKKYKNNKLNFPHIEGLINIKSVVETIKFEKNSCNDFYFPENLFKYVKHEKSCGAVVYHNFENEYKILLISFKYKNNDVWGFPKRHIEENETEIQTAIREIYEETGINVNINDNFRIFNRYFINEETLKEDVHFAAITNKVVTKPQFEEVSSCKWCSFRIAKNLLTFGCDKDILEKFIKFSKKPNLVNSTVN